MTKNSQINVRLEEKLKRETDLVALATNKSRGQFIREAIREHISKNANQNGKIAETLEALHAARVNDKNRDLTG